MICYEGNCVNQSTIIRKSCDPNPCHNGGQCVLNNLNTSFMCNCAFGYSGLFKLNQF